jgi:hypothetical protein
MWVLFYMTSLTAPLTPIFGFTSLKSCEGTRVQMERQLGVRKSACIAIAATAPALPPAPGNGPEEHQP